MGLRTALAVASSVAFVGYGIHCLTSRAMEREFARYGLRDLRMVTGWLELLGGLGLFIGLWWPLAFWISTGGLALLMACGLFTRLRMRDPFLLLLPALLLLLLNTYLLVDSLRGRV